MRRIPIQRVVEFLFGAGLLLVGWTHGPDWMIVVFGAAVIVVVAVRP